MAPPIALTLPLLPGQLAAWQSFVLELHGPLAAEFAEHRQRVGLDTVHVFHQPTPQGDLVIWYMDGDDPTGSFAKVAASDDDFDCWYVDQLQALHGISREVLAEVRPGKLAAGWG
jgi:hypothetical protein